MLAINPPSYHNNDCFLLRKGRCVELAPKRTVPLLTVLFLAAIFDNDDGVAVGPDPGKPIPDLKSFQVIGEHAGKEINWKTATKDKAILFVFVRSEKWDRPTARLLKKLDDSLGEDRQKQASAPALAIIWVTKEPDKAKEYLPRAQQSLKLEKSSWNVFSGEIYDMEGWVLSGDAMINIVIAKENRVAWGRAYQTANETLVRPIRQALGGEKK